MGLERAVQLKSAVNGLRTKNQVRTVTYNRVGVYVALERTQTGVLTVSAQKVLDSVVQNTMQSIVQKVVGVVELTEQDLIGRQDDDHANC